MSPVAGNRLGQRLAFLYWLYSTNSYCRLACAWPRWGYSSCLGEKTQGSLILWFLSSVCTSVLVIHAAFVISSPCMWCVPTTHSSRSLSLLEISTGSYAGSCLFVWCSVDVVNCSNKGLKPRWKDENVHSRGDSDLLICLCWVQDLAHCLECKRHPAQGQLSSVRLRFRLDWVCLGTAVEYNYWLI